MICFISYLTHIMSRLFRHFPCQVDPYFLVFSFYSFNHEKFTNQIKNCKLHSTRQSFWHFPCKVDPCIVLRNKKMLNKNNFKMLNFRSLQTANMSYSFFFGEFFKIFSSPDFDHLDLGTIISASNWATELIKKRKWSSRLLYMGRGHFPKL